MTREEAINSLNYMIEWGDPKEIDEDACKMGVKALEQESKWIPVSERLPEPDVEVLVTDDAGGLATISTDSIYEIEATGKKEWYISQNVTTWMPLPEPYKEGQDDSSSM